MTLILSRRMLEGLVNMAEAIRVVEEAFKMHGLGKTVMPQRTVIQVNSGRLWFSTMPAYVDGWKTLTVKAVSSRPENRKIGLPTIQALIVYLDSETGTPLALMEAGYLTGIRTGAVGGVAAKYLARPNIEVVGVLGSGEQAWRQLEALTRIRRAIRKVKVFSPNPKHRAEFAEKASASFGLEASAVNSAEEAVKGSDIILAATSSREPVVLSGWVEDGAHITSVGAHMRDAREIDGETVAKAKVVVDSREACLQEAGDLLIPMAEGLIGENHIYAELGEIVAGLKPGRTSDSEITLFKSVGLAIQDAAVAKLAYEKAKQAGVGFEVNLFG